MKKLTSTYYLLVCRVLDHSFNSKVTIKDITEYVINRNIKDFTWETQIVYEKKCHITRIFCNFNV